MKCQQCRADVDPNAAYCHQCGARLIKDEPLFGTEPEDPVSSFPPNTAESTLAQANPAGPSMPDAARLGGAVRRDAPEEKLWRGSYSPKAMVGFWILDGLIGIACVAAAVMFPQYWWAALAVMLAFSAYLALQLGYRRLSVSYRLTSQRLLHQHGLLSRTTDRIEVIDMDDVTCVQGPIERMLGVGSIRISSSDRSHPELWLRGIEDAQHVALLIDDARRAERLRRGLHIESI